MVMGKVNPIDGSLTNYPLTGVTETPCSFGGYWGDYDALIISNYSSFAGLDRYLTDSTHGACNPNFPGGPQHVSVAFGAGTL
jgi:hypothetical protein